MSDRTGSARRVRRRRLHRGAAVAVAALATMAAVAPGSHAESHEDEERRAQRERQAELAMKLDPATASGEDLVSALTTLDQYVQSLLAQGVEAERAQRDAERRAEEARTQLGELQGELTTVTNALRTQAVRLYLDPEASDESIRLMKADSFDNAEQRRVLNEILAGNTTDLRARWRVAKARRDMLQAEVTSGRDEAQNRDRERQDLYIRITEGQATQTRLQTAWDQRMRTLAPGGDDISDATELDRIIAENRAKQAPAAPAPGSDGQMLWPAIGPINDPYGYLKSRGRNHWGIDIGGPTGTNVVAALGGRVVQAGWSGDYGNLVVIDHPNGLETRYAHLSRIRTSVGATVAKGQLIGNLGSTGNSTGPHLHFEVYLNGAHRNPMNYLPPRG